jgi:hypothetical protein
MRDIRSRGNTVHMNINSKNKNITEITNKNFLCKQVIIDDVDMSDLIKMKEKIYDEKIKITNNNDNN